MEMILVYVYQELDKYSLDFSFSKLTLSTPIPDIRAKRLIEADFIGHIEYQVSELEVFILAHIRPSVRSDPLWHYVYINLVCL